MSLSYRQILEKFPEAVETVRGNGTAYVVNCWHYHKHGGIGEMEINPDGVFYCHNCGESGTLYNEFPDHFIDMHEFCPWIEIKKGTISSAPAAKNRTFSAGIMWGANLVAPGETVSLSSLDDSHPAIEYLTSRGFDTAELKSFNSKGNTQGLYYCTKGQLKTQCDQATMTGRIVFPVYMEEVGAAGRITSVLNGWQARTIEYVDDEDEESGTKRVWNGYSWRTFKKTGGIWEDKYVPKYYTSPGRKKTTMLGGIPTAKGFSTVAIVEGPLDKYKAGRHSVFTFGKNLSNEQIRILQSYWTRVIIVRDPEINPTDEKFVEMLERMYPLEVHHLSLADNKDPGATTRSSIWNQISDHVGDPSLLKYAE